MQAHAKLKKGYQALNLVEQQLDAGNLTAKMVHNAMVNLNLMLGTFGVSATKWTKVVRIVGAVSETADYTEQDLREFIDAKRAMFEQHAYVLA